MKPLILLLILTGLIAFPVYPQRSDLGLNEPDTGIIIKSCLDRNIMYFTAGVLFGTYLGGHYERIFVSNVKQNFHVLARMGIGKVHAEIVSFGIGFPLPLIYAFEQEYNLFSYMLNLGILTGKRSSHLEAAFGGAYLDGTVTQKYHGSIEKKEHHREINPVLALGFRYQKPEGHFLFRIGAGWPEQVYLSLGLCF